MKYNNFTLGQVEAIINKLGGEEGAKRFLRGETIVAEPMVSEPKRAWRERILRFFQGEIMTYEPTHPWCERDGIIYFSVTSDGTTGREWVNRLKKKGIQVGGGMADAILLHELKPTSGVTTKIAVIRSEQIDSRDLTTEKICAFATECKFIAPSIEVACLILDLFSEKDLQVMGIWDYFAVMHEPVNPFLGVPRVLGLDHSSVSGAGGDLGPRLCAYKCRPEDGWFTGCRAGFVFAVAETQG